MGMHYVPELLGNFQLGGPNLAAADCGRGREAGFQSYKEIRAALFPNESPITSYDDITTDKDTRAQLEAIYGPNGVEEVDLFVGALAEDHLDGAGCGKTFAGLFKAQLDQIRYRDHGWFERLLHSDSSDLQSTDEELYNLLL